METFDFPAGKQQAHFAIYITRPNITVSGADFNSRLEYRHLDIARGILEEIRSVVRLIGTANDHVVVTVTVIIHRQRPCPKPHAQIHNQVGIVVLYPLESVGVCRSDTRQKDYQKIK